MCCVFGNDIGKNSTLYYHPKPAIFLKYFPILQWSIGFSVVVGVCCLPVEVSDGIGLGRRVGSAYV